MQTTNVLSQFKFNLPKLHFQNYFLTSLFQICKDFALLLIEGINAVILMLQIFDKKPPIKMSVAMQ